MADEKRPEWMTSISSIVNPEDYLLGRKIDKTFELGQKEKIEKAREARIELIAQDKIRFNDDPILDLERRRKRLKMELIQNPILLKQFRDKLLGGKQKSKAGTSNQTTTERESELEKDEVKSTTGHQDSQAESLGRISHEKSRHRHNSSRCGDNRSEHHHHHGRHRSRDRHERPDSSRHRGKDREASRRESHRGYQHHDKRERRDARSNRSLRSRSPYGGQKRSRSRSPRYRDTRSSRRQ